MSPNNQKDSQGTNLDDFHPVPKWLTKNYMENILQLYKNDKTLKVLLMNSSPATAKGENYASIMTRCKVTFMTELNPQKIVESLIVKTSFENDEFAKEILDPYDIFNREMEIYEKIIPKLNSLLIEIDDNEKLFAQTVYVDYVNVAMIFKDLTIKSYVVLDRLIGLDDEHAKLALRKLAKMHATSAVLNERNPGIFHNYNRGFYNRCTTSFRPYFVNTFNACSQMISKLDNGAFSVYGDKMKKLLPHFMEFGAKVFDAKDDELNVLAHGDIWITNLMYIYDKPKTNHPKDVLLIDFQYSVWTSPATDLHYFFSTSLMKDLKINSHKQDELIQYYYYVLADTLRALKFNGKIPSLHEFWINFHEKGFYGVSASCVNLGVVLNEQTENADFQALLGDDERSWNFKHLLFQNTKVQEILKVLLPQFDRRGLLDVN